MLFILYFTDMVAPWGARQNSKQYDMGDLSAKYGAFGRIWTQTSLTRLTMCSIIAVHMLNDDGVSEWTEQLMILDWTVDGFGQNSWWLWTEQLMTLDRIVDEFEQNNWWLWTEQLMTLNRTVDDFEQNSWWLWTEQLMTLKQWYAC